MSEPTQTPLQGPQGDAMDIDPPHLTHHHRLQPRRAYRSPESSSAACTRWSTRICNLRCTDLRVLCGTYNLPKMGNKMTLTKQLTTFSVSRRAWDGLDPSAHNKHRGPRDGGITKDAKKKGSMKQ
ncbi:hypothetical protein EI94DRAFT_433113 [Lactarius quietus]|nr:hypothetical protein EI94DRAFT_433113 [Lactarius quietus]